MSQPATASTQSDPQTAQQPDPQQPSQQPQPQLNDNQNDVDDQKQPIITQQTYPTLDETPTFNKNERSKLENDLYDYFQTQKLLINESTINDDLLNKIGIKFGLNCATSSDVNKFIYLNKANSPLFQTPTKQKHLRLLACVPHDNILWKTLYFDCKKNNEWGTRVSLWNLIQHQTVNLITNVYNLSSPDASLFRNALEKCVGYSDKNKPKGPSTGSLPFTKKTVPTYLNSTEIATVNMDCIVTGIQLKKSGFNPVVLNLANQEAPAAATSVRSEGGTQEECLFKRSTLYLSLWPHKNDNKAHLPAYGYDDICAQKQSYYPMHDKYGGIYSPNVYIFRGSEQSGYAMLPLNQRCILSFIAVAARVHYSMGDLNDDEIKAYKHKIRTIYRIAYDQGHDSIVLGALGCGIFNNPPQQVAKLFYDVLKDEFNGYFARVVFAILWDHNSKPKLVQSFQKYFPKNDNIFNAL